MFRWSDRDILNLRPRLFPFGCTYFHKIEWYLSSILIKCCLPLNGLLWKTVDNGIQCQWPCTIRNKKHVYWLPRTINRQTVAFSLKTYAINRHFRPRGWFRNSLWGDYSREHEWFIFSSKPCLCIGVMNHFHVPATSIEQEVTWKDSVSQLTA